MSLQPQRFNEKQQMKGADQEIQYKRDQNLTDVKLHHHDFYEIYYLVSGDVTYTIESKLYPVLPGDLLLISPRELHQVNIQPAGQGYERFVLWLSPQYIMSLSSPESDLLQALDPTEPDYRNHLRLPPADQLRIRSLMEQLYAESQQPDFGTDLLPRSLVTQLLVHINRLAAREEISHANVSLTSPTVARVVDYINANYPEHLSLEMLAEKFYISKYHLSHEFQRQVGTSVCRYLQKKRLQIARQLLSQGQRPSQVYLQCGFRDYAGFYRAFRAEYGIAPSALGE